VTFELQIGLWLLSGQTPLFCQPSNTEAIDTHVSLSHTVAPSVHLLFLVWSD